MRKKSREIELIVVEISARWGMTPAAAWEVYRLARDRGYGKCRKIMLLFGMSNPPSVRQIKYFVRKVRLTRQYGIGALNTKEVISRRS